MSKEYALVVAGGTGARMKSEIPKQFLELGRKPLLMHTLSAFYEYSKNISIILVLPGNQAAFWEACCKKHDFSVPHEIVEGGAQRQDSVKKGLECIGDEGYVAIHDGVRPFIGVDLIKAGFDAARKYGNAIASIPLKDSIRFVNAGINKSVNRTHYRIVQTPQTFLISQIKKAYEKCDSNFTDDAGVAESAGIRIHLIEGSYENIKITTSEDLVYGEAIFKRSAAKGERN